MTNYDVQLQKEFSLREFLEDCGREDTCGNALIRARYPEGFVCPECGSTGHYCLVRGQSQCQDYRKQTSPTTGTIFQGTKLPLTVWF
ncbi:transposase [Geothrix sp.]|uniref:transposase n=1 Tax=Geothrix sp. TaxID=1962974 RepID=UPI00344C87D5